MGFLATPAEVCVRFLVRVGREALGAFLGADFLGSVMGAIVRQVGGRARWCD